MRCDRALLALLLLAGCWLGMGQARAACEPYDSDNRTGISCDTASEAYAAVASFQPLTEDSPGIGQCAPGAPYPHAIFLGEGGASNIFYLRYGCFGTPTTYTSGNSYASAYFATMDCESGFDTDIGACNPSQAECLVKPALDAGYVITTGSSDTCNEGCKFSSVAVVEVCLGSDVPGEFYCLTSGHLPTGEVCPVGMPAASPMVNEQVCVPVDGQTVCVRSDGQHCYPASTGKQICWDPGETGTKTTGPVLQQRVPGTAPGTPTPPPGETLTQTSTTTITTTVGDTIITTTTTNYDTANGTDAGDTDSGVPADGSEGGLPEGGEGEGTAGGGSDCDTPPVVSGDQILAMVATQTWATRCAVEAGNAAEVSGDISDCAAAFSVTGTNANAQELRVLRAKLCKGDADGDGLPDYLEGEDPNPPTTEDTEAEAPSGLSLGPDLLDMGGMLGGSTTCPELGVLDFGPFGTFDLNSEPMWCGLVTVMRAIVLLMAAFTAIKILMGGM